MSELLIASYIRPLLLCVIFLIAAAAVLIANGLLASRQVARQRVDDVLRARFYHETQTLRAATTATVWNRMVDLIERRGLSLNDSNDGLRQRLWAAGFSNPYAARIYTLARLALTLGLPILFLTGIMALPHPPSILKLYFGGAFFALIGLYGPSIWISGLGDRRRRDIINGFPDSLDLLLVCVEAGLGIEAALDRVSREIVLSAPLIAAMLSTVVLELRAGRSREEALRRMAERNRIDEIRSFATLMIQSDRLGTSIGQALRIYATEMREKRRMRAEEKAHRLPVLLSIPLVACMLPVMIGVLMLPAGIRIVRDIAPVLVHR